MLVRAGIAMLVGLVLIMVEAFIVMKLKNYSTIRLGTISQFMTVWVMNFLLVLAILNDFKNWLSSKSQTKPQLDDL